MPSIWSGVQLTASARLMLGPESYWKPRPSNMSWSACTISSCNAPLSLLRFPPQPQDQDRMATSSGIKINIDTASLTGGRIEGMQFMQVCIIFDIHDIDTHHDSLPRSVRSLIAISVGRRGQNFVRLQTRRCELQAKHDAATSGTFASDICTSCWSTTTHSCYVSIA